MASSRGRARQMPGGEQAEEELFVDKEAAAGVFRMMLPGRIRERRQESSSGAPPFFRLGAMQVMTSAQPSGRRAQGAYSRGRQSARDHGSRRSHTEQFEERCATAWPILPKPTMPTFLPIGEGLPMRFFQTPDAVRDPDAAPGGAGVRMRPMSTPRRPAWGRPAYCGLQPMPFSAA